MTLGIRKLIVVSLAGVVFLIANFLLVANWLQEKGIINWARGVRQEYLTGTAITTIAVLLVLLVTLGGRAFAANRRCPVCDRSLPFAASYCSDCGSKV